MPMYAEHDGLYILLTYVQHFEYLKGGFMYIAQGGFIT